MHINIFPALFADAWTVCPAVNTPMAATYKPTYCVQYEPISNTHICKNKHADALKRNYVFFKLNNTHACIATLNLRSVIFDMIINMYSNACRSLVLQTDIAVFACENIY